MITGGAGVLGGGLAMAIRGSFGQLGKSSLSGETENIARKSNKPLCVFGHTELADAMRNLPAKNWDNAAQEAAASTDELVFIDHADDLATVAEIERFLTEGRRAVLVAHIRDSTLRHAIVSRLESTGIEPRPILFGLASVIARNLIHTERLFDQAYWRDQPCLHALVVGFSALGRACMEEAIFAGIAGHLASPRITILDPDPERVVAMLTREMPELAKSAEVRVLALDHSALADPAGGTLAEAEEISPLTAIFICLADERERVSLMSILSAIQTRHNRALAPVFVLSEDRAGASLLACPLGRARDIARRFVVAGGCPIDLHAALISTSGDITAKRLHEVYRAAFGGKGASSVPWETLPENYREANRHAARHLPQKLWTAGLIWSGSSTDMGAVAPEAYKTIIEPVSKSTGEDALMRRLARLEHDRWCAERRLGGWSYGQNRDESRQLHPNLISFDDPRFTDLDIAKDIEQIRFLFGAAAVRSPDGASSPIVVGVLSADTEGVDIEDALAVLSTEPWRPVVILSALADQSECTIVDQLVAMLREAGRAFRLLVPEQPGAWQFGGGIDSAKASRAVFLALSETRIVPIGVSAPLGDEWTDPAAPVDDVKMLADYIRQARQRCGHSSPSPCLAEMKISFKRSVQVDRRQFVPALERMTAAAAALPMPMPMPMPMMNDQWAPEF